MQNFGIIDTTLSEEEFQEHLDRVETWAKGIYPQGGIIIIMVRENDKEVYYWHECGYPISFSNDTVMQDPKVYKGLTNHLFNKIDKINEEYRGWAVFVGFWVHPDLGMPLEKYTKVSGFKFPGSPRR